MFTVELDDEAGGRVEDKIEADDIAAAMLAVKQAVEDGEDD